MASAQTPREPPRRPFLKRFGWLAGAVAGVVLAGFAVITWYAYTVGMRTGSESVAPLIRAERTPEKVKPTNPGAEEPHQGTSVYGTIESGAKKEPPKNVEQLLPPPEEPVARPKAKDKPADPPKAEMPPPSPSQQTGPPLAAPSQPAPTLPAQTPSAPPAASAAKPPETKPTAPAANQAPAPATKPVETKPAPAAAAAQAPSPPSAPPAAAAKPPETKPAPGSPVAQAPAPTLPSAPAAPAAPAAAPTDAKPADTKPGAPTPLVPPTPPAAAAPPADQAPKSDSAAKAAVKPSSGGTHKIQLVATRTEEEAKAELQRLRGKHGDVLGKLNVSIVRADLGEKGVFYRVQAGPLDPDGAKAACAQLRQQNAGCLVVRP